MSTDRSTLQGAKTHDLKNVFFWSAETPANDPDVLERKPLVAVRRGGVYGFGVLTFLLQDMNGGLQVWLKSAEWVEVRPFLGSIVCNIGDLLAQLSNDRCASILHCVINRSGHAHCGA